MNATTEKSTEQWSALNILERTFAVDQALMNQGPEFFSIYSEVTQPLNTYVSKLRWIHAGVQESPRHAISGESGAIELLTTDAGAYISRSSAYSFIEQAGWTPDDIRSKSLDELVHQSPLIAPLIKQLRIIYEQIPSLEEQFNSDYSVR